jgi:hypothetical protein
MEKIINLLDGKQRGTTLEKFLNNEIKLGYNILPVKIEEENEETYNVTGLKWEELPDVVKTFFKLQKIQMVFFKSMSYEDQERQFIKLQGGKKLSNAEINKVRIGHSVREFIYKQLASDLWTKYTNISSNRETRFETMQQVLMVMLNKWDLSGKSLQAFSEDSEMITDDTDMLEQVEQTTEYLNKVVKLIKKNSLPTELQSLEESEVLDKLEPKQVKKYLKAIDYFKKVNVPIIYINALKALQNDITVEQYAKFITSFFLDVSARYKRHADSSTADSINVKGRVDELDKALVTEFKIVEKVVEQEQPKQEESQQSDEDWEQSQNNNTDQEEKDAVNNILHIVNKAS